MNFMIVRKTSLISLNSINQIFLCNDTLCVFLEAGINFLYIYYLGLNEYVDQSVNSSVTLKLGMIHYFYKDLT